MTALLRPDETLTLGVNVIVREGDRDVTHEIELDAPQDWVALTGPCPTCRGSGSLHDKPKYRYGRTCPDCRDGRRIVPLYRKCPDCGGAYCGQDRLVGRAAVVSIEPGDDGRNYRIALDVAELAA